MKYIILIIIFSFNFNTYSFSNEAVCSEFKKFSVNFMKCKTNLIKDNAVSKGKDFVNDTKSYQKKEWSKEKN